DRGVAGFDVAVGAHHGHAERDVVVVRRVRTGHGPVQTAGTSFPHAAEPVDQHVVADIAPAAAEHVVGIDAANDARHLRLAVAVGPSRVVDDHPVDLTVGRGAIANGLVSAPLLAAVDTGARCGGRGVHIGGTLGCVCVLAGL